MVYESLFAEIDSGSAFSNSDNMFRNVSNLKVFGDLIHI